MYRHLIAASVLLSITISLLPTQAGGVSADPHQDWKHTSPRPEALALGENGELVVSEQSPSRIAKIDPRTGERTVISGAERGNKPLPNNLWGIAVLRGGLVLVSTQGDRNVPRSLLAVEPATGSWEVFSAGMSASKYGRGLGFSLPGSIAVRPNGKIVVVDYGPSRNAIIEVDPSTRDRRTISDVEIGKGPLLGRPLNVVASSSDRLFVSDGRIESIVSIDLATGDRTPIAGSLEGSGPVMRAAYGLAVMPDLRLAVSDVRLRAILIVNLLDGSRTVLSAEGHGRGPGFLEPGNLVFNGSNIFVVDRLLGAIFVVDPETGDRRILHRYSTPGEPPG